VGGTIDATCRYIIDVTGTNRGAESLRDELLAEMVKRFAHGLPLHEGAIELVDEVRRRGVPTALVSSSFRVLVDAALRQLGSDRFDVTVAGDEVSRGKPHPEPYRTACSSLGVDATTAVVLEDAMSGVVAAEAAGCTVVAVPFVTAVPEAPGRHVVRALTDIDVDWLLALPCS
jgi:HAD superfamily hydrolase (TIGR01509 family)